MQTISTARITATQTQWRQQISTGHHQLIADKLPADGGQDTGPAPYDYLLASLGACTAITLQMYAKHKGWPLDGLVVDLSLSAGREGQVHIARRLSIASPLTDEQRQRILEVAARTPVTKTLLAGAQIDTSYGEPSPPAASAQ